MAGADPLGARAAGHRILVATRHYSPELTGSGPVIQELAEWLARAGATVEVVTVRPNYPGPRVFPGYENGQHDDAVEGGVRVIRLATTPIVNPGLLSRAKPEARFMAELGLARFSKRFSSADAIISLCPSILTVTGALALSGRKRRHVAVVHDIPSGLGSALGMKSGGAVLRLLRTIEAWTLNRVDHIVVLSAEMENALRKIGVRTPVLIVPPHIDTGAIRPLPRPDGAPLTVMYSGNLGRKQGLEQLLGLARVLKSIAPEVRVLVRGDGAMREALMDSARSEGLANVVFEPLVPKSEVARSLAEGDVHLVPQLPDGQEFAVPSKAFAIMAAGRPFVATAAKGSPLAQLVDEVGSGVCTEPGDVEAFAHAALALLQDSDARQRMGDAGRAFAVSTADTSVVMSRIFELLQAPASRQ